MNPSRIETSAKASTKRLSQAERSTPAGPTSPVERSQFDGRTRFVAVVVLLVWGSLAVRLVQLQHLDRVELSETATAQSALPERIPARPGNIVDRNGRLLAGSIVVRSLFVDPSRIDDPWQTAFELATALEMNADHLFERLSLAKDKRFFWVKRRLSETEAERVRALALPRDLWGFREEYLRRYPQQQLAAHVLGLRNIDGAGRGGIEEFCDGLLSGTDGSRVLTRDARGRVIEVRDDVQIPPRNGADVRLSIDAVIQLQTERELSALMRQWQPKSACAIVMDPHTGEVLAMASAPTYDPNHASETAADAWKNTAIAAIYEPGSTLKPMIVAEALESTAITMDERFHCEHGVYQMGPRTLHDHHPYGILSLTDVLVKSSNVGMAKIGERLTNEGLHRACVKFGLGRRTGVELPGELSGILRPLPKWNIYSTGSIPMGQEVSVTPLQLITAHAMLANGGRFVKPTLVVGIERQTASVDDPPIRTQSTDEPIVSEEFARWLVREPMHQTVERGTGTRARLSGLQLFGKTGTAQKIDPERGGYSHQRHVASFVCGAPVDDPRAVVLVVVDEPSVGSTHYGGTVAAPTAARILQTTLRHLSTK